MTEKRFERVYGDIEVVAIDNWKTGLDKCFDDEDYDKFVDELNRLNDENEQLKKQIQQNMSDIWLCQSFITDKGYSMRDLKEWEDSKKECYPNAFRMINGDSDD